jgi:hypothetical protein
VRLHKTYEKSLLAQQHPQTSEMHTTPHLQSVDPIEHPFNPSGYYPVWMPILS